MNKSCRRLTVTALIAALAVLQGLLPAPAGAATAATSNAPISNAEAARIVRATYARLADYTAVAEHPLSFQLSGFATYGPDQFGKLQWLDLATMPDGRMIDVTRNVQTNEYVGVAGALYQPSWAEGDAAWANSDEAGKMVGLSAADALAQASAQTADFGRAIAITAFRVTVNLAGESRTYAAAVVWVPNAQLGQRTFYPVDHITQGVEEAARESYPSLRDANLLSIGTEPEDFAPAPQNATCTASSSTTNQGYTATGTANHFSGGYHRGTASFRIVCSCTSTCASTCTASIPSASCTDSGTPIDMCHKMASSLNANTVRNDNGNLAGAGCAAGYGCVKKSCLFCLCGLGVSVSVNGVGVTFTPSGDPDWTGNLQYSRTCAKCV